jgi:hypothetical protein
MAFRSTGDRWPVLLVWKMITRGFKVGDEGKNMRALGARAIGGGELLAMEDRNLDHKYLASPVIFQNPVKQAKLYCER